MDLNTKSIHYVVHPTAAFLQGLPTPPRSPQGPAACEDNPAPVEPHVLLEDRADVLMPLENPLWRIDGSAGLGTQFFVVPLFLEHVPPMRFDVFVPEKAAASPFLREALDLNAAFHTKDGLAVAELGISRLILRRLQLWTTSEVGTGVGQRGHDDASGKRRIGEHVSIAPTYHVERQLLSLSSLASTLSLPRRALPPAIGIDRMSLVRQLHDSVCVVHLLDVDNKTPCIFKAITSDTKYLYSELRALLLMEPHPNIIGRPKYIVTKRCAFGGKVGVVGFVLPYHPAGGLRDTLPLLRAQGRLALGQQLRWARQMAAAVLHISERWSSISFYPDLRLDNIVLSAAGDVVMVDFEQRGVWCEFASPEVNALEYRRLLAVWGDEEANGDDDGAAAAAGLVMPSQVCTRFGELLEEELPGWRLLEDASAFAPSLEMPGCGYDSFNVPWLCLSPREQEAAEVYMLGRVLWCIFEGQSAPQKAAVWQSYKHEPDIEFPEFRRTPQELRGLLDRCTRGRRAPLSDVITRSGSKLVLRRDVDRGDEQVTGGGKTSTPEDVLRAASAWWKAEVKASEDFLTMRSEMRAKREWTGNFFERPSLREVVAELDTFKAKMDRVE